MIDRPRCHYKVLGCTRNATKDEIRKAYLNRVKVTHPDKRGAKEGFQDVQEAYTVLSNYSTRKEYDQSLQLNHQHNGDYTSDERFREQRAREAEWIRKSKKMYEQKNTARNYSYTGYAFGHSKEDLLRENPQFARPTKENPMFDVDAWERGHRLGRWGDGPEADYELQTRYFSRLRATKNIDGGTNINEESGGMCKHQRYVASRIQRHRRREQTEIPAANKGQRRNLHTMFIFSNSKSVKYGVADCISFGLTLASRFKR